MPFNNDSKKVLVLEDETAYSNVISTLLKGEGYEAVVVDNVLEASELVAQDGFYAATIDGEVREEQNKPVNKYAGWKYAYRLRNENPVARIAMCTGTNLDREGLEELASKNIAYIKKPVNEERLRVFLE